MNQMTDSHILLREFDYFEPATLQEAVNLLAYHGESACLLGGGTDLLVHMKMERAAPAVLVSLRRLSGLAEIDRRPDGLHIGALATVRALRNHLTIRHYYPALAEACASFSTTQVQTMDTLGGNLCKTGRPRFRHSPGAARLRRPGSPARAFWRRAPPAARSVFAWPRQDGARNGRDNGGGRVGARASALRR